MVDEDQSFQRHYCSEIGTSGEDDPENGPRAPICPVEDFELRPVELDGLRDDGKTQPGSFAARADAPVETFDDAGALFQRNARALIFHFDIYALAPFKTRSSAPNGHKAPRGRRGELRFQ